MTEQLERDLSEMFSYAAEQLDVRPAAAPRRFTRLNTALAGATAVALVAGVAVVGARLAATDGAGSVSTAAVTGQAAIDDLRDALFRTLRGRGEAITRSASSADGSGTATGQISSITDYDGASGNAITRSGDRIVGVIVGGHYFMRIDGQFAGKSLPAKAEWAENYLSSTDVASGTQIALGMTISGLFPLMLMPEGEGSVREVGSHFEIDLTSMTPEVSSTIQLTRAGLISTVTTRFGRSASSRIPSQVIQTTFRPLSHPVDAVAPDPRTVVSESQYQAAIQGFNKAHEHCRTVKKPGLTETSCTSSTSVTGSATVQSRPHPVPSHS